MRRAVSPRSWRFERHHRVSQSVRWRMAYQLRTAVERGDFQDVALLHDALDVRPWPGVHRVLEQVLSAVHKPSEVLRQVHSLGAPSCAPRL